MLNNSKIAIACFSTSWGGREIVAQKTILYLNKAGVNVIAIIHPENKGLKELRNSNITVINYKIKKYFDVLGAFKLSKILKKEKITGLSVHNTAYMGTLTWLKVFYPSLKIAITHHIYSNVNKKTLLRRIWIKNIDYFIAVSLKMKNNLETVYPSNIKNKIRLIYNGIDDTFFKQSAKNRTEKRNYYGYTENDFVIGMIGRLDPAKGHLTVLKALAEIKNNNIKLLIVGDETVGSDGSYTKKLKDLIKKLSLKTRVKFVNFTEQVNKEFSAIDLFIMASETEAFGMVVAEAMLSKVPVLMSDSLEITELVNNGSTALEYKYNNIYDLSEKIIKLYENKELVRNLVENAYKYATKNFTKEIFIKKTISLFF